MLAFNVTQRMRICSLRDSERQSRSSGARIRTCRDNVVERCQAEPFARVQQGEVLGMCVVVAQQNASQNAAKQAIDVLFAFADSPG